MTWQDKHENTYLVKEDSEFFYTKESRITREEEIRKNMYFHKQNPKSVEYYKNLSNTEMSDTIQSPTTKGNNVEEKIIKKKLTKMLSQSTLMFNSLVKVYKKIGYYLISDNEYNEIKVLKFHSVIIKNQKDKEFQANVRTCIGGWKGFKDVLKNDPYNFTSFNESLKVWIHLAEKEYDAKKDVQSFFDSLINDSRISPLMYKYTYALESKLRNAWAKPPKQLVDFKEKSMEIFSAWMYEAQEVNFVKEVETKLNFEMYENSFPLARGLKRHFSIFVGPTNSGKTYAALNELQKGSNGLYLAPLRLMASEGQEALADRGIVANLLTGEEQQMLPYATHTSSTVEMCNFNHMVDVCIIDEIQMIADPSRGWAWTQALVGVPSKHVVLVGSDECLPIILPLIEQLGETYEIKNFERKTPLTVREPLHKIGDLKANDCVVVFSRKAALEMKAQIETTGKKCSVIYGNLSPEVRRAEAAKFKSGENQILVATDAIGMGLNLPIQRLFFSTLEKYDGTNNRSLNVTEIKQIGGRAGRFGLTSHGEVGVLGECFQEQKDLLARAIYKGHERIADTRAAIAPNLQQIEEIGKITEKKSVYSALIFFREKMVKESDIYKTANLEAMIELAAILRNKVLPLDIEFAYSCVPIDPDIEDQFVCYNKWINNHMRDIKNTPPPLPDEMEISTNKATSLSLYAVENYVKLCMAYRWLHYKYPDVYSGLEEVTENAKKANKFIEKSLERSVLISQLVSKRSLKR